MKMHYSIEHRDIIELRIYVKGYGFFSFAKNMSNKYNQNLVNSASP